MQLLSGHMKLLLCNMHNIYKINLLKTAKFNIYLEKSEKMSYSKNTKTIKNFNRVDEQKETHL